MRLVNALLQPLSGPLYNRVICFVLEEKMQKAACDVLLAIFFDVSGIELPLLCFLISLIFNTLVVH